MLKTMKARKLLKFVSFTRLMKTWLGKDMRGGPNSHLLAAAIIALLVSAAELAKAAPERMLPGHVPPAATNLPPLSRVPPATRLDLAIGLPLRNEEALTNLLQRLYDPTSPDFRRYLTPERFTELFGPSEAEYQAVIHFANTNHLTVAGTHANRLLLEVNGTVENIEKAFNTHLNLYLHPSEGRTFFAPDAEPGVPQAVPILDISGLENYVIPRPMSLRPKPATKSPRPYLGSGPGGSFRGSDFRAAYAPGVTLSGAGQTVGLLEFDGYYASDIASYESQSGLGSVPLQNVLLNHFKGSAGANNIEVALDIELVIAMAPGVSKVTVYEGTQPNTILSKMATDNQAKQLSSSWSYGINSTTESIYRQFAAQGQTMFQASGDDGAYSGSIPPPSDDPNLTIVGGTTLATSGPGGSWTSETTWNWANSGAGTNASSGGISTSYPIPVWQQGISMSANNGSTTMRNIPDVALTADDIMVVYDNGTSGIIGGTSAAAPLWAGFMALINQQALADGKTNVGFLNPTLYSFAKGQGYSSAFHDITTGNNTNASNPTRFFAVSGYDLCTGWGTPKGQSLIDALSGNSNTPPTFITSPFKEPTANVAQLYSATISTNANDLNPNQTLTFAKVSGPSWLSVAGNGSLSGTPANANAGTNSFVVSVTDSGGLSSTATMYINVNGAPSFTSNPFSEPTAHAGQLYSASIAANATDPNPGDTLSFAKVSGPAWLSVAGNGSLSGTPANANAGTNSFLVSVTDSGGLSNTATMYINVNGAPSFSSNPFSEPTAHAGQLYSASIAGNATDPNQGDTLSFAKISGPGWLNITTNGLLSGVPADADAGTNSFVVSVTDSGGLSNTATMNIVVLAQPTPIYLQISATSDQLLLSWTGGNAPFQVQLATNLLVPNWQNLGTSTTNYSLSISPSDSAAFYRVQGQ